MDTSSGIVLLTLTQTVGDIALGPIFHCLGSNELATRPSADEQLVI